MNEQINELRIKYNNLVDSHNDLCKKFNTLNQSNKDLWKSHMELMEIVKKLTNNRVYLTRVEVFENEKNSAIYEPTSITE